MQRNRKNQTTAWSAIVIKLFIWCLATKFSTSTDLQSFNERDEQRVTENAGLDIGQHGRHLRSSISRHYQERQTDHSDEPAGTNSMVQQDLSQINGEQSGSSFLTSQGGSQFQEQIQVCLPIHLNFAKAANGRTLSGGEFVRGEWFHKYGLKIYAKGHDGKNDIHPMIFDSSHVESNGLGGSHDVFALGSPNFDCEGFGVGSGGKIGRAGENCEPLGNLLIPSRNPRSPNLNLSTGGQSSQPPLGGVLIFEFNEVTKVETIGVLNVRDSDEIMIVHNDGNYDKVELSSLGQNGFQNIHLDMDSVKKLYINLHSFGAVTGLDLCVTVG